MYGQCIGDLAFDTAGQDVLVSERFLGAWRESGLDGLSEPETVAVVKARPVSMARRLHAYFHVHANRGGTRIDFDESNIIVRRHAFTSGVEGVSQFAQGMGHIEIRGLIQTAGRTGAWRVEGASRVLDVNVGRVIGTDRLGNPTKWLRVVATEHGSVITSYPIGAP